MKKRLMALAATLTAFLFLLATPTGTLAEGENQREEVRNSQMQFRGLQHNDMTATFDTSAGTIVVVLYERYAPIAVANFRDLAGTEYYNDTTFHRVVEDFVVQGGDPTGTGTGGESLWGEPFKTEAREGLRHYSGALCMAAAGVPNTHQSQFYFVATPQGNLNEESYNAMREAGVSEAVIDTYNAAGGLPYLDYTDTVFGQVIEGMEVVDAIARVKTKEGGKPEEDIVIHSITIERYQDPEVLAAEEEAAAAEAEEENASSDEGEE